MAIYKLGQETKKETIEDRLNRAINLGRREALKEVLKWLDENFSEHEDFSFDFVEDIPYQCLVECNFESKEEMIQSFKERFNIE